MTLHEEIRKLAEEAAFSQVTITPTVNARIIESAILAGVKREPSEAMVDAVTRFPEHLRAEHPDPADEWHNKMEAAHLVDQAVVIQNYRAMTRELMKELTEEDHNVETKRSTA